MCVARKLANNFEEIDYKKQIDYLIDREDHLWQVVQQINNKEIAAN
jgi:hypothetical protein